MPEDKGQPQQSLQPIQQQTLPIQPQQQQLPAANQAVVPAGTSVKGSKFVQDSLFWN